MAGCSAMEALQERIAQMKEMLREWLLEDGTVALWAEHTVGKSKCRGGCWRQMTNSLRRSSLA